MERIDVSSSNISSVGFDPKTKTLEVEFYSGGIYQYSDVPETVYSKFIRAESVGKFFHIHVKKSYKYRKM